MDTIVWLLHNVKFCAWSIGYRISVRIWIWALVDCVGAALYLDLGLGSGLVHRLQYLRTPYRLQCSHCFARVNELISFLFLRLIQPSVTCSFLGMSDFTDSAS